MASQAKKNYIKTVFKSGRLVISSHSSSAFTFIELIFVFVIVGILTGLAFANIMTRLKRERLLTTSKTLVSWLEERRREGMVSIEQVGTGACVIAIDTNLATLSATAATIRPISPSETKPPPNICRHSTPLELRKITSNSENLSISVDPTILNQLLFSFRGTSTTPAEFKLKFPDSSEARCVRITTPLGLIRQGIARPPTASCIYLSTY